MKIRNDEAGQGHYGAKRGNRRHKGVDVLVEPGAQFLAPFSMKIKRVSKPYADSPYSGVAFRTRWCEGRIWYIDPSKDLVPGGRGFGWHVMKGDVIGESQDISKRYPGTKMKPHVHIQIDSFDPQIIFKIMDLTGGWWG